jgi:HSP20 family protein
MRLQRWDPFRDIERLHEEMDRLFRGFALPRLAGEEPQCTVAVDILEDKDNVVLKAEIPGVNPKDVELQVHDNVLTISGEKKLEHEDKKDNYVRIERFYGKFSRSFTLPPYVDTQKIEATYKDGVLTVTLPKKPETKPRQIEVKTV